LLLLLLSFPLLLCSMLVYEWYDAAFQVGFQAIAEALGLAAVKAAVAITAIIAGGRLVNLFFSRIMAFKWMDGISLDWSYILNFPFLWSWLEILANFLHKVALTLVGNAWCHLNSLLMFPFCAFCSCFDQFINKLQKIKMQRYSQPIHFLLFWGPVSLLPGYGNASRRLFEHVLLSVTIIVVAVVVNEIVLYLFPRAGWTFHGTGGISGWFASCRNRIFLAGWIRYCSISRTSIGPFFHDGRCFKKGVFCKIYLLSTFSSLSILVEAICWFFS